MHHAKSITLTGNIRSKRLKPATEVIRERTSRKKIKNHAPCNDGHAVQQAVSGTKRISTCAFCNSLGHRKGTCEKRTRYGRYLNKGFEKDSFPLELTSSTSSLLPPLPSSIDDNKKESKIVLESIPKDTNHVIIVGKAIINPFINKCTEDNLAISIYCIGNDGERLRDPYNGLVLIMAGKLRKWVSQNSKNIDRIILAHEKATMLQSQFSQDSDR